MLGFQSGKYYYGCHRVLRCCIDYWIDGSWLGAVVSRESVLTNENHYPFTLCSHLVRSLSSGFAHGQHRVIIQSA